MLPKTALHVRNLIFGTKVCQQRPHITKLDIPDIFQNTNKSTFTAITTKYLWNYFSKATLFMYISHCYSVDQVQSTSTTSDVHRIIRNKQYFLLHQAVNLRQKIYHLIPKQLSLCLSEQVSFIKGDIHILFLLIFYSVIQ